jgi:phosphoglycolate phosphatase
MPGVLEALERLRDLRLAVCTNKPRAPSEAILRAFELGSYFSAIVGGGDVARQKPDPEPLLVLARALGVDVQRVVMVGDGPQDIACGKAAGARTVGVRGPIVPIERLAANEPDALLGSMHELPDLILRWQSAQRSKQ